MSLNERIGDLAGLVGLILALITLLTANRNSTLTDLRKSASPKVTDALREMLLDASLVLVTSLVFLAGFPLWIDTIKVLHPLSSAGPVRSVFALAWLLLVPLIVWQARLSYSARKLKAQLGK